MPPPAPGCASCASHDVVIEELASAKRRPTPCPNKLRRPRAARLLVPGQVQRRRQPVVRQVELLRSGMPGWRSGWPGWNGSSVVTATTPRCPRRQTTGLGARRRRGRPASGRNVAGVSSQGRPRVDNPDETVQVFPATCADCGVGLADGADAGVSSRQVFDVPPVTVRVTEYMLYRKQCRCGCVTTATPPAGVADAPVSYGPNLQAFV